MENITDIVNDQTSAQGNVSTAPIVSGKDIVECNVKIADNKLEDISTDVAETAKEIIEVVQMNGTEKEKVVEDEKIGNEVSSCAADNNIEITENSEEVMLNEDETIIEEIPTSENSELTTVNEDKEETKTITQEEWAKRENELLEKIAMLQNQQDDTSNKGYQLQLKVKCEENSILKAKIINLETELSAVLKKPNAKNKDIVNKIKKQHEELLTKAKGMIFDKTKMIKNQELQIEALSNQVTSLKEVVTITKNLLEIRNLETKHLQERLEVMDMKIKAEKERYTLMTKKVDTGTKLNEQLKAEYDIQLRLFKELKIRYEEKFRALEEDKKALKGEASGTSTE